MSRRGKAAGVLVALGAAALAATALSGAASARRKAAPQPTVYWGAVTGSVADPVLSAGNVPSTAAFATAVGKRPSLIPVGYSWYGCGTGGCAFVPFPTRALTAIRSFGAIPLVSWASANQSGGDQSPVSLAAIAAGTFDSFLTQWADAARRWGHPFFLRFDWEMNIPGLWPWSPGVSGNTPAAFVAAWRHVHDIFVREGARNATWVWCPNVEYAASSKPLAALYPGSDAVDWTCLDGYNPGTSPHAQPPSTWRSFASIFGATYATLTRSLAPGKPVMVAETASSESGGSKAAWIATAYGRQLAKSFPRIRAIVWYDRDNGDGLDWPLSSSAAATTAFAKAIASPYYSSGRFSTISSAPIGPPATARKAKGGR
jgi:hypothetical protein